MAKILTCFKQKMMNKRIGKHMMYVRSYKDENIKYNARFVTTGFREQNINEICKH